MSDHARSTISLADRWLHPVLSPRGSTVLGMPRNAVMVGHKASRTQTQKAVKSEPVFFPGDISAKPLIHRRLVIEQHWE